jgi:MerR family copper efflux transcriptional regulator
MKSFTIGHLAKAANVSVETVRFYERKGLLQTPERKHSAYRQYDGNAVDRLKFIRRAQQVGFTLKEIEDLLGLRDNPDAQRADVRERALNKIAEINAKISDLQAMRKSLTNLLNSCEGDGPASACPIITSLQDNEKGTSKE